MSGGDLVTNGSSEDVRKLITHSQEEDVSASYDQDAHHHHRETDEVKQDHVEIESHLESHDEAAQPQHLEHDADQTELVAHSPVHSDDGHTVPNGGAHVEPPDDLHHNHHGNDQHHANEEESAEHQDHELDTSAHHHEPETHHHEELEAHHSEELESPLVNEHAGHHHDEHQAHQVDERETELSQAEDRVHHVDNNIVENGQQEEDRDVRGDEEEGSSGPGAGGLLPRQDSLAGVDEILQSPAIRREIDEIIGHQLKLAPAANDLLAMQQLSDYLLPKSHGVGAGHIGKGAIIPIADVQGSDAINYVEGEQSLRCKVAALYRLVDMFNWTRGFNSLMSCRISQEFEHFLVAPHGLLYSEVTAASLVRVDRQADILHAGTTTLGINHIAFKLHGALHASRPDLKCLIHLRNPTAVSVSVMKCGLLPLCPEAMELGDTSFYDFPGIVTDDDEVDKLIRAFGPSNRVLIMKNFGILVGGVCVEDAFHSADSVMTACDTQLRMIPLGLSSLKVPSVEERKKVFDERNAKVPEGKRKFTKGMLEFEELMRLLDDAGYRTGYPYHPSRPGDDDGGLLQDLTEVAAPPTVTSFAHTEDRSRSKEKKPKVYAKDTEAVTAAQSRPIPTPITPHVLNVQQLKERYREIRQQYYDTTIASRRETARQSKARSLSRGRKRDSSQPRGQTGTGPSSSKPAESSKQATATSSSSKTPTSSAPAPKTKTPSTHAPVEPAVQAVVESPRQSAPAPTINQSPNDASTSKHTPSRTQSVKHKSEEAENIASGEKPKKSSFFERSKSLPHKKKSGKDGTGDKSVSSPTKSTSSGEGVIDTSSQATPSKEEEKKKKKKGFSLPSFGKKDKEKKAAKDK